MYSMHFLNFLLSNYIQGAEDVDHKSLKLKNRYLKSTEKVMNINDHVNLGLKNTLQKNGQPRVQWLSVEGIVLFLYSMKKKRRKKMVKVVKTLISLICPKLGK